MKQDELREKVRFLKWHEGIDYKDIASFIGLDMNSFYNFISGKKVDLGYKAKWRLETFIKETEKCKNGKQSS